jgi:hypothetical protein
MGRPLHKKYFGNRNIGSASTTADDGLGGGAVASVTLNALGAYTTRPTITFANTPKLPGGVRATGTITSEVLSAAISGSQTRAYPTAAGAIGFNTGGTTFTATVTSSALSTVVRATATTLGFDTTTTAMISGTSIHITGASITGTMTIGGVAIAAGQIYYVCAPTTATTATLYATYADSQAATAPLTIVAGTGVGGATFTRGVTHGTVTALTVVARGSYEALVASGPAVVATAGVGEGLVITPTYRAKAVVITEAGSGYTAAPTPTFTESVTATSVNMLVDSGNIRTAGNQENAIIIRANTSGSGTTALIGDIIRQVSTRRYKVKTADGIKICKLGTDDTPAPFGAYIVATAASGGTYYVTKLTAHRATLVAKAGNAALDGQAVQWTFNAPSGSIVQLENA